MYNGLFQVYCNTYLKENDQVSAEFTSNFSSRFNGKVFTNSETFRFEGILTRGRFEGRTGSTPLWGF